MKTLSCSICFIRYDTTEREAIVLPCGHTFCLICTKTFKKTCPTCREDFLETQVKKNYIVHALLDELNTKVIIRSQETCGTHKREIDRFCKSCEELMCSVCHCAHIGSMEAIISDINLRDEVQNALEPYKDMESTKKDLNKRIDDYLVLKIKEIEGKQTSDLEQLEKFREKNIQESTHAKEAKIQKAEKEAREKIQEIETNKLKVINQAIETADTEIKEIESQAEARRKNLFSQAESLLQRIQTTASDIKQQTESLQ